MSNNLGCSVLTSKSNNDNLIQQTINKSIRVGQKFMTMQQKDEKISIQLEYMRLQQQYRRQSNAWQEQVNDLRGQLQRQQQQIHDAQNKQIQQKHELNQMHKQNIKLFQQNQKHKKLVNTLKGDNQALELQIERWKSEKKTYAAKLDNIYEMKRDVKTQLSQKNNLIQDQQAKIRQLQKKLSDYKLKTQQLSGLLTQKQRDNKQLSIQVRTHLQSFLQTQNNVVRLQHQIHQTNQLNYSLKDKIMQLQKQKQILLQRIYNLGGDKTDRSDQKQQTDQYYDNQYFNPNTKNTKRQSKNQSPQLENIITPTDQRLMLEIQSFMRQFQGLLQRKAQQKNITINQIEKVVNSVECLQKSL